ncbi:MAG: DUF4268 domain-containing protein, partial [Chloroflexi bacterium]|nr:DUF4268 domain-containing protein [Chloroflexota bacterium]
LLASDGRGRTVVIENQLGSTDHSHLGQLLTYMAGFDANVIVWIAKSFRDEHAEALSLLNRRTGEDTEFFGIEVELWSIDESRPAVNFNLITVPNEWGKRPDTTPLSPVSERNERYRDFFQGLIDTLRDEHRFTNARKAQPSNWYSFSTGRGRVKYGANFAMGRRARIELYIDSFDADWIERLFDHLLAHQTDIESELAASLEWERLEDRKSSRIAVVRPGSIDDDDDTLNEIQDWMVERLLKFKEVFGPRLADFAD